MNHTSRAAVLTALFLTSVLAACGGSGGGSSPMPLAPTAIPVASTAPGGLQTYQSTISNVANVTSGTLDALATASVSSSASTASPTGVALRRRDTDSQTPLIYVTVAAVAGSATVNGLAGTIAFTSAPGQVSIAAWNPSSSSWVAQDANVSISGSTVTFSLTLSPGLATPAYFALYSGTPLPSPSPSAMPSSSPSALPSASATASPSSAPTNAPSAGPTTAPNACSQTPQPGSQTGTLANAASSFMSTVQSAQSICLSVWEPSSQVQNALVTAATNHADVTVIYPIEEYTADSGDATTLSQLGARILWANDTGASETLPAGQSMQTSTLPVHAKFALVDGIAYIDGHNWFSSDVIIQDGVAGDYAAIQNDLTNFPSSPPTNGSLTTDKYLSLQNEAALITNANPGAGQTVQFISESFEDYGPSADAPAVYAALTAAAKNGATVDVIAEGPSSEFNSYENCDLQTLAYNGAHVYVGSGGSEKITLIGPSGGTPTSAWIGSSNMSDYDFIDWGLTVTNASVVSAMSSYYGNALSNATAYPAPTSAPSCSL